MQFVGDKSEIFESVLESDEPNYPDLRVADFQRCFHYLSNETEENILFQLRLARVSVNSELRGLEVVTGDDVALYQNAIFCLCASYLIDVQLSSDSTQEAAHRQDALSTKRDRVLAQHRNSIDFLKHKKASSQIAVL